MRNAHVWRVNGFAPLANSWAEIFLWHFWPSWLVQRRLSVIYDDFNNQLGAASGSDKSNTSNVKTFRSIVISSFRLLWNAPRIVRTLSNVDFCGLKFLLFVHTLVDFPTHIWWSAQMPSGMDQPKSFFFQAIRVICLSCDTESKQAGTKKRV